MSELVRYERRGDVALILIDNPPVNALSPGVPEGIEASVRRAISDSDVRAIVLAGSGRTFIAGADIREFGKPAGERVRGKLASSLVAIENSPKPVIAAIHGTALGGGLETAMACHYRVIATTARVGQPEVKIGLVPGAGGTQRLPRLAGMKKAVEMCAFGEPISAQDALAFGIADRMIDGDLIAGAIEFAQSVAGDPIIKTRDRNQKLKDFDPAIFEAAREKAGKSLRGQEAPLAAIDAVEAAAKLSFEDGIAAEARLFEERRHSTQCKAMIHAFFSERAAAKIPDIPGSTRTYPIANAAIVGAGTMGGGIAMVFADAGIPVRIKETTQDALDRGMKTIQSNYARYVKSGRVSESASEQRLRLITPQLSYDGFDQADIIVEAVFERIDVKKSVFTESDRIAKADCVLATNTSSLDVDEIATVTQRPEAVLGLHFFSPANIMRLVEVVRGKATSNEVLATAMALSKRLNKTAVLSGNSYGFIGNRMMHAYSHEAQLLVEEGASVENVNGALYNFGMAMGPLAMHDLIGIDIVFRIQQEGKEKEHRVGRQPIVLQKLFEAGRLGQKNGKGWSKYDENRKAAADPEVQPLIEAAAKEAGIQRRTVSREEIVDRCIFALVNEGAQILEEGVALRASDIDVVYLNGYGFPIWRGGPMFYADTNGLKNVLSRIDQFGWTPAPLLKQLATEDRRFNEAL